MFDLYGKYSYKWIYVLILLFVMNLMSLALQGYLFTGYVFGKFGGFAFAAALVSFVVTLGGYIGAKAYFRTAFLFNLAGILYMLYVVLTKKADGWSDLAGVISYLLITGVGVVAGSILQAIVFFKVRAKNKPMSR